MISLLTSKHLIKSRALTCTLSRTYASGTTSSLGRTTQEIAERISCLQLMLSRWGIEAALKAGSNGERIEAAHKGITQAINTTIIKDKLTNKEKDLTLKPLGNWSNMELNIYQSNWESLGILQWTLNLQHAIPQYNHQFSRPQLFRSTAIQPVNPSTIDSFLATPFNLRDLNEFHNNFKVCETWHWRSKAQNLLNLKNPPEEIIDEDMIDENQLEFDNLPLTLKKMINNLPDHIKLTAEKAYSEGLIPYTVESDFGVDLGGIAEEGNGVVAYKHLDLHHQYNIMEICKSRLFGFCWAVGAMEWDDDPADIQTGSPIAKIWDAEQV